MRRIAVVLIGIGLVILGGLWIFKDIYGENIAGAAEDIAVNMVAIKINESLKTGFNNKKLDGALLQIEPDTRLINKLVLEFATGVRENYDSEEIQVSEMNLGVLTGSKFLSLLRLRV